MTGDRLDELDLPLMVRGQHRGAAHGVHRISVDYRHGTTHRHLRRRPGRHHPGAHRPRHPARATWPGPGHIFPLRYREGGVLKRAGHTEAAVDLARMAGLYPAGVLCEIVNEDEIDMARVPDLERVRRGARPAA